MYTIEYAKGITEDLKKVRTYERTLIFDSIDEQLKYQPGIETRNRKILVGLTPPWEYIEPI